MYMSQIVKGFITAGLFFSASVIASESPASAYDNPIVQEKISLVDSAVISTPRSRMSAMSRSSSGAPVEYMTVNAMGREFELELEVNELFNQNLQVNWQGQRPQSDSTYIFYKGKVKGVDGSWVRLTVNDGEITGTIRTPEEIYTIEPKSNLIKSMSASNKKEMVMYRMSEVGTGLPANYCGVENDQEDLHLGTPFSAQEPEEEQVHAYIAEDSVKGFNKMIAEMRSMEQVVVMASSGIKELKLGVAADYEYYQIHGEAAAAKIQSLYNQIDGIYREELGIALNLTQITVFNTPSDPYSDSTDSYDVLTEAGSYFSTNAAFSSNGINQMITGKNLDGSTIGLAYVGTVCYTNKKYRVSLIQNYESFASAQLIVAAHEMGHNLGATHDSAADGMHIMWPSNSSRIELTFSERSKAEITPYLSKSCFATTADIKVDMEVDAEGGEAQFTATVTNKTQENVIGAVLVVDMPSDLDFVEGSIIGYNCTETLGQLSCDLGDMQGAAVEEITFAATYETDEQIRVDATVASDMIDFFEDDNSDYALINEDVMAPSAPAAEGNSGEGSEGDSGGSGGGGSTGLVLLALLGMFLIYRKVNQLSGQKVRMENKKSRK